jgi:hypothetical protein
MAIKSQPFKFGNVFAGLESDTLKQLTTVQVEKRWTTRLQKDSQYLGFKRNSIIPHKVHG